MIEVIPAIIPTDFEEIKEKIKMVESYVGWVQLDIMDGIFVNNTTWRNPDDLKDLETSLNLEVHLMVYRPEEVIDDWINSNVKRIIFHYEGAEQHQEIISKIKQAGLGVGMAINPETPINVLDQFIKDLDLFLIMTVNPGFGGQEIIPETISKIKELRNKYPNIDLQVDGGVNLETAPRLIEAGANILVSGSTIFKSQNIEQTIKKLKLKIT